MPISGLRDHLRAVEELLREKRETIKIVRPKQVADFAESVFGKEQGWPRKS